MNVGSSYSVVGAIFGLAVMRVFCLDMPFDLSRLARPHHVTPRHASFIIDTVAQERSPEWAPLLLIYGEKETGWYVNAG